MTSSGQLPTGLLSGTISSFGDYDQCLAAKERAIDETQSLSGKYCLLEVSLPILENNNTGRSLLIGASRRQDILPQDVFSQELVSRLAMLHSAFYTSNLTIGLCVPSTCSGEELVQLIQLISGTAVRVSIGNCQTIRPRFNHLHLEKSWLSLDLFEKISLSFVIFSIVIVLLATVCDTFSGHKHVKNVLVKSFSLLTNIQHLTREGRKIVDYDCDEIEFEQKEQSRPRKLYFIEGLRVLAMLWVVSCHAFSLGCLDVPQLIGKF